MAVDAVYELLPAGRKGDIVSAAKPARASVPCVDIVPRHLRSAGSPSLEQAYRGEYHQREPSSAGIE
jgi:hypothetical protein